MSQADAKNGNSPSEVLDGIYRYTRIIRGSWAGGDKESLWFLFYALLEGYFVIDGDRTDFSWRDTCIFAKRDGKWTRIYFHTSPLSPGSFLRQ